MKRVFTSLVRTFRSQEDYEGNKPYTIRRGHGSLLLVQGRNAMQHLMTGGSIGSLGPINYYDSDHAYIGVGTGADAEDENQTGLTGGSICYRPMETGYPLVTAVIATYRSVFGPSDANWPWEEHTVCERDNNQGYNLYRAQETLGTKTGGTWELTVDVQLTKEGIV